VVFADIMEYNRVSGLLLAVSRGTKVEEEIWQAAAFVGERLSPDRNFAVRARW
jgi:hypothetical protein